VKTVDELVAFSATVEGQGTEDHQNCTCTTAELRLLANQLVRLERSAVAVEIGIYGGRSASLMLQLQRDLALDVHLVDNWSWDQKRATDTFVRLILENFNEVPFTLHKMRSDHLAHIHWRKVIDFLHIDGWHDIDGIEPDCINWLPWVRLGGVVAFHDSDCEPVARCIDKYVRKQGWEPLESAFRMTTWRKP
jgi:predicted O-methyltransferase YrrM